MKVEPATAPPSLLAVDIDIKAAVLLLAEDSPIAYRIFPLSLKEGEEIPLEYRVLMMEVGATGVFRVSTMDEYLGVANYTYIFDRFEDVMRIPKMRPDPPGIVATWPPVTTTDYDNSSHIHTVTTGTIHGWDIGGAYGYVEIEK